MYYYPSNIWTPHEDYTVYHGELVDGRSYLNPTRDTEMHQVNVKSVYQGNFEPANTYRLLYRPRNTYRTSYQSAFGRPNTYRTTYQSDFGRPNIYRTSYQSDFGPASMHHWTHGKTIRKDVTQQPAPYYSTPFNNNLSGDGKSMVWTSMQHYVPSERSWIKHHDYRSLPMDTKRDAIDFQSEDDFVYFMRHRDTPSGYYNKNIGIKQSGVPELRLFGYTRDLPEMPSKNVFQNSWPKSDGWIAPHREGRGGYYGYYHQAIENERERRRREYPTSWMIEPRDIPKI